MKGKRYLMAALLGLTLVATVGCAGPASGTEPPAADGVEETDIADTEDPQADATPAGEELDIKVTPDGVRYIVEPDKIVGGGPPKDGIPSIDSPEFVSVEEADEWIQDDELVLSFEYRGVTRVYPLQIMVWHEIVNDVVVGDPILITY